METRGAEARSPTSEVAQLRYEAPVLLPPISEVARAISMLIGNPTLGEPVQQPTMDLLRMGIVDPKYDEVRLVPRPVSEDKSSIWGPGSDYSKIASTGELTPNSPVIVANNVGDAKRICTLTIAHHQYLLEPRNMVIVMDDIANPRVCCYLKRGQNREGKFQQIRSLDETVELARLIWSSPLVITLWDRNEGKNTYACTAGFKSESNLIDLIRVIQETGEPQPITDVEAARRFISGDSHLFQLSLQRGDKPVTKQQIYDRTLGPRARQEYYGRYPKLSQTEIDEILDVHVICLANATVLMHFAGLVIGALWRANMAAKKS